MKKSLSKILARMARDGDIETVAEIIEEMIEPEAAAEEGTTEVVVVETPKGEEPATASGGNLAGSEVIRNEQAPQCGAATIENAETTIVVDEATLGEVIARLDQIIALLTPAAQDEDPVEEIVEAVEEAVEAAAEAEAVAELPEAAEEVAAIVEEILEPEGAEVLSGDECGENEPEVLSTGDALRAALKTVRPALAKLPKKQRRQVCADIAARLNGRAPDRRGVYAALNDAARKRASAGPDLGKKIMASRNPNYKQ